MTFEEILIVETYRDAFKEASASVNGSCEKIVTASFSLVTAYGALLALVTPKDTVHGLMVSAPFALLALAALFALIGHTGGVSSIPTDDLAKVRADVEGSVDKKRQWAGVALVLLAAAIVTAGWVVYNRYAEQPPSDETAVTVALTNRGIAAVTRLCGDDPGETVTAEGVTIDTTTVELTGVAQCDASNLTLPVKGIIGTIEASGDDT